MASARESSSCWEMVVDQVSGDVEVAVGAMLGAIGG